MPSGIDYLWILGEWFCWLWFCSCHICNWCINTWKWYSCHRVITSRTLCCWYRSWVWLYEHYQFKTSLRWRQCRIEGKSVTIWPSLITFYDGWRSVIISEDQSTRRRIVRLQCRESVRPSLWHKQLREIIENRLGQPHGATVYPPTIWFLSFFRNTLSIRKRR